MASSNNAGGGGIVSLTGNYHECKPLYVGNGDYLLCVSGRVVRKVSAATGELVGSFANHIGIITSLRLVDEFNPSCSLVVSASVTGEVIVWRYSDLEETLRISISFPVYDAIIPLSTSQNNNLDKGHSLISKDNSRKEIYLVIGKKIEDGVSGLKATDNDRFKLVLFDFENQKIRKKICKFDHFRQTFSRFMIAQYNTEFLLGSNGSSSVFIWNVSSRTGIYLDNGFGDITCFSSCSDGSSIATGHSNGAISVWYNMASLVQSIFSDHSLWNSVNSSDAGHKKRRIVDINKISAIRPVCTKFHWHSLAVKDVCFNADGTYIYSGGEEGVLVIWHVASQGKSFLPRVGESITFVESSRFDSKVAITTSDNAVRAINVASIREEWCLQAVSLTASTFASTGGNPNKSKSKKIEYQQSAGSVTNLIKVDSHTGLLFSNGFPGRLQVFDPDYLSLKQSIDVVQYVRVSKKEADSIIYVPNVTKYCLLRASNNLNSKKTSTSQLFIATVDVYRGEELAPVNCLKFWSFNEIEKSYVLNTQVEFPHGEAEVTEITFSHFNERTSLNEIMCCTVSDDGYAKIWKLREDRLLNGVFVWNCAYSFKHREGPLSIAKFSLDNSILAIASSNIITLWDPLRVELKGTLVNPVSNTIFQLDFLESSVTKSGLAILLATTKHSATAFNLISMSTMWTLQGKFTCTEVCCPSSLSSSAVSSYRLDAYIAIAERSGHNGKKGNNKGNRVLFIEPRSGKLLNKVEVPQKVSSLCFRHTSNISMNFPLGLFVLLDDGTFYFVSGLNKSNELLTSNTSNTAGESSSLTQVFKRHLAALPINPATSTTSGAKPTDSQTQKKTLVNTRDESWLKNLLDENTNVIPSVTSLFDGLLANVMQKPSAPVLAALDSSSTANTTAVSLNILSGNNNFHASKQNVRGSKASEISVSNSTVGEQSTLFENNLLSFFKANIFQSSFPSLVSSNASSTPVSKGHSTPSTAAKPDSKPPSTAAKNVQETQKEVKSAPKQANNNVTKGKSNAVSTATALAALSGPNNRKRSNSDISEISTASEVPKISTSAKNKTVTAPVIANTEVDSIGTRRSTRKRSNSDLSEASTATGTGTAASATVSVRRSVRGKKE